jgi:hypothetical protein
MISYNFTWENEAARGTVSDGTGRAARPPVESRPGFPQEARAASVLTRRRVVDYCRVNAAL